MRVCEIDLWWLYCDSKEFTMKPVKVRLIDGVLYDPWSPEGPAPSPATVAHGLAALNRYGGHTQRPYSVAEHSIWVAFYLAFGGSENDLFRKAAKSISGGFERGQGDTYWNSWERLLTHEISPERQRVALLGLVHDVPEGCGLVDVPGPILRHAEMAEYKRAHERCMAWICREWKLLPPSEWPEEVKAADVAILGAELSIRPINATGHDGSGEDIPHWPSLSLRHAHNLDWATHSRMKHMWLSAYSALSGR